MSATIYQCGDGWEVVCNSKGPNGPALSIYGTWEIGPNHCSAGESAFVFPSKEAAERALAGRENGRNPWQGPDSCFLWHDDDPRFWANELPGSYAEFRAYMIFLGLWWDYEGTWKGREDERIRVLATPLIDE